MNFAPVIVDLERSIRTHLEQESQAEAFDQTVFAHARAFLFESDSMFQEVQQTLLGDQEVEQKLILAGQELSHTRDLLARLESAVSEGKRLIQKERLEAFLASYQRCWELFSEFTHLSSLQPIFSPVPSFDSFIKAGIKVREGKLEPSLLEDRFPRIWPELARFERHVRLLPKLHQIDEGLLGELQRALQGLQAGFGALKIYFDTKNPEALEDGLKLIGSSSTIGSDRLGKVEDLVASSKRFCAYRPLEEWLRLRDYALTQKPAEEDLPTDWIEASVADLISNWGYLLVKAESLLHHPLLVNAEVADGLSSQTWETQRQVRHTFDSQMAGRVGRDWLEVDLSTWDDLGRHLETLQTQVLASQRALEVLVGPFREVPGLERIASLKEQVRRGQARPELLLQEFQNQLSRVEDLIDSVSSGHDPISAEFREILPLHRSAYLGMQENLEAGDWEGLDARWEGLLTTLPTLAALSRSVKQRVARQSSSGKQIACLRCQAKNDPGRRVCSSCGANLPAVVTRVEGTTEIDLTEGGGEGGGGGGALSPRALDMLEDLVQRIESNQIPKQQAKESLELFIKDLNEVRTMFGKKVVPLMGKDQVLDSYLRFFAQGLGSYFAGLMEMHAFCETGSLPQLHSGLASCRETLEVLEELKARIDEALRG